MTDEKKGISTTGEGHKKLGPPGPPAKPQGVPWAPGEAAGGPRGPGEAALGSPEAPAKPQNYPNPHFCYHRAPRTKTKDQGPRTKDQYGPSPGLNEHPIRAVKLSLSQPPSKISCSIDLARSQGRFIWLK